MGSGASGTELDELRRRIYRPGATEEDRARYRLLLERDGASARPAVAVEDLPRGDPAAPAIAPGRRAGRAPRRGLLLAAVLAVLALAGVGVGLVPRAPDVPTAPAPQPLPVSGAERAEFVQNLAGGGAAGIAAYLITHRSPEPLRAATRLYTIERHGTGPLTFSLSGTPADTRSGRATVFLVLQVEGRATWTAYRVRPQMDDPSPLQASERRTGDLQAGVLTSTTFGYRSGGRPVQLEIDVPKGVRWGAAVVFSD